MKIRHKFLALAMLFGSLTAEARDLYGVTVGESLDIEGQKMALFGAGLRSKLFVKVYVGGLYLSDKGIKPSEILESPIPKAIKLHFKRDVDMGKIRAAWSEGFANNCSTNCEVFKKDLEKINDAMSDMKEKETMSFFFSPDKVSVYKNDVKKIDVASKGLARQILAIFLGDKPADKDLKKGMLGG
jgi:long-chain acyl-CoA synthetase